MPQNERDERQERERIKAVDLAVGQIEKQFGKGSIMRLGQKGPIQPIDAIPTGNWTLRTWQRRKRFPEVTMPIAVEAAKTNTIPLELKRK